MSDSTNNPTPVAAFPVGTTVLVAGWPGMKWRVVGPYAGARPEYNRDVRRIGQTTSGFMRVQIPDLCDADNGATGDDDDDNGVGDDAFVSGQLPDDGTAVTVMHTNPAPLPTDGKGIGGDLPYDPDADIADA